jgi:hypothetical protein
LTLSKATYHIDFRKIRRRGDDAPMKVGELMLYNSCDWFGKRVARWDSCTAADRAGKLRQHGASGLPRAEFSDR